MNRNITAFILIAISVGVYFTFTSDKIKELNNIRAVNADYEKAIEDSARLIKIRDDVLKDFNDISDTDKDRLNKIVPDNVDNVRLIIDVKDDIAFRHNLSLKNIKTSSPNIKQETAKVPNVQTTPRSPSSKENTTEEDSVSKYGIVTLSFNVTTSYQTFVEFLRDLESSLRIMDISKLTVATNESNTYDFGVELKTYWLKQ